MNAEASVASENWERLLSTFPEQSRRGVVYHVNLTDIQADLYDFANEVLMRRILERLVVEIQRVALFDRCLHLQFGNKFFMTMNEQQQQSFFHNIFNPFGLGELSISVREAMDISMEIGEATDNSMESPAITISTSALLETLPHLSKYARHLFISNFALTRKSDVQEMLNVILARRETLRVLMLSSIKFPVDDCIKQDSNEPNGFFDPLLHAASDLYMFWLSAKTRSVHSTLVSPMALRALFVEGKGFGRLSLHGLGLSDSHVLAIVDGLSTPGTLVDYLDIDSNPGITAQGYDALFNLINRANVIGSYDVSSRWRGFHLDDEAWEGKLKLVSEMNSWYGRLEYLTNGTLIRFSFDGVV